MQSGTPHVSQNREKQNSASGTQQHSPQTQPAVQQYVKRPPRQGMFMPAMQKQPAGASRGGKPGGLLGSLASKLDLSKLETEDLILLLILYLLYRESGDEELLIMMGAMLLL